MFQVIKPVEVQDQSNVFSLIFNNNFHVTGSKSLFARITHLVVVVWRTITCFVDCFTFSLGLVPRFSCYSFSISKCCRSITFRLELRTKVKKVHHHSWSFCCCVYWRQRESRRRRITMCCSKVSILITCLVVGTLKSLRNPLKLCISYCFYIRSSL